MLKKTSYAFVLFLVLCQTQAISQVLPNNLVSFDSHQGKIFLKRSFAEEYLKLSMQFLTQKNQAYCGVASIAMVLNALGIKGPIDPIYAPFHPVTQDNFFTAAVQKIATVNLVSQHGLTLDQATEVATQFKVQAHAIHSNDLTLTKMRHTLITALNAKNQYVIINFFRPGLKEEGGGHFSPIAAYDLISDRFLILDVARYKYPPVWAKAADVWQAINTIDTTSKKTRGILLIETSG